MIRLLFGLALLVASVSYSPAFSQDKGPIRIGVLSDESGIYKDTSGSGSVIAVQMAVEDFGGKVLGRPIEVLVGDHKNKPDIGSMIVREWLDTKDVQAVFDLQVSGVALAVLPLIVSANKVAVMSSVASSDFTGKYCTPNSVHWTHDSYAISRVLSGPLLKQGYKTWFFISPDSVFGQAQERDISTRVLDQGGKVIGSVKVPLGLTDFSSALLTAQASKADVVVIGSGGEDLVNALKQAQEFGLAASQQIVSPNAMLSEINGLGLQASKGTYVSEAFYWDLDEPSRAWSKRFVARYGKPANMLQAGNYGAVLHYLKAVQAAGTTDGAAVVREMKKIPIEDFMTKDGYVREDGRVIRNMYLFRVKAPAESHYPFDSYALIATVPGEQAFRPLSQSECPLIRK